MSRILTDSGPENPPLDSAYRINTTNKITNISKRPRNPPTKANPSISSTSLAGFVAVTSCDTICTLILRKKQENQELYTYNTSLIFIYWLKKPIPVSTINHNSINNIN
eukprot:TRINITY_DN1166_c0_g1_i2.p1 TRINITY_DN1166_c0_g1~~TRINITY_DN1166_c0_g1_i2.p1  ORF type:complete len:121 (+),score=10.50 TRINITY_DN1166_c0_g1_i2:42-365(+)